MDEHTRTQVSRVGHRAHRCFPFLVVVLCFCLPIFTLSSCGTGQETTATGVDIVTGSTLIRQQDSQPMFGHAELGPIGPDPAAQAASRAARPWAIVLLVLLTVGAIAALVVDRHWRSILGTMAALALVGLWMVLTAASEVPSKDQLGFGAGTWLASLTLLGTTIWYAGAALVACIRRRGQEQDVPAVRSSASPDASRWAV